MRGYVKRDIEGMRSFTKKFNSQLNSLTADINSVTGTIKGIDSKGTARGVLVEDGVNLIDSVNKKVDEVREEFSNVILDTINEIVDSEKDMANELSTVGISYPPSPEPSYTSYQPQAPTQAAPQQSQPQPEQQQQSPQSSPTGDSNPEDDDKLNELEEEKQNLEDEKNRLEAEKDQLLQDQDNLLNDQAQKEEDLNQALDDVEKDIELDKLEDDITQMELDKNNALRVRTNGRTIEIGPIEGGKAEATADITNKVPSAPAPAAPAPAPAPKVEPPKPKPKPAPKKPEKPKKEEPIDNTPLDINANQYDHDFIDDLDGMVNPPKEEGMDNVGKLALGALGLGALGAGGAYLYSKNKKNNDDLEDEFQYDLSNDSFDEENWSNY